MSTSTVQDPEVFSWKEVVQEDTVMNINNQVTINNQENYTFCVLTDEPIQIKKLDTTYTTINSLQLAWTAAINHILSCSSKSLNQEVRQVLEVLAQEKMLNTNRVKRSYNLCVKHKPTVAAPMRLAIQSLRQIQTNSRCTNETSHTYL